MRNFKLLLVLSSFVLVGCPSDGKDGEPGSMGPAGPQGEVGPQGPEGPPGAVNIFWENFEIGIGPMWVHGGDADWFRSAFWSKFGGRSAASGVITHDQASSLSITVNFPQGGIVSFYGGISSEAGFDFLVWDVDGTIIDGMSGFLEGGVVWIPFTFSVPPGTHTITWEYAKDAEVSAGLDGGWIDGVAFMGIDGSPKLAPPPELPEGFILWSEAQKLGLTK